MKYNNSIAATFISRPNRFIAYCQIGEETVKVHVKNTGRCKELLIPGVTVYLEYDGNPRRKTAYSLIAVQKGERLINMDSQVPNKVFYEAVRLEKISLPGLNQKILMLKPEKTYKNSRFDAYIETETEKAFVEVKGVTLEEDGIVRFPDAPTERGIKHIYELIEAVSEGYKAYLVFIIQMNEIKYFTPNRQTQEAFAVALELAEQKGVTLLAYDCTVQADQIEIRNPVPVILNPNI